MDPAAAMDPTMEPATGTGSFLTNATPDSPPSSNFRKGPGDM